MSKYEILLTDGQNDIVRKAVVLHMAVNSGELEAILETPFARRRLTRQDNGVPLVGFWEHAVEYIGHIKGHLISHDKLPAYRTIYDFPLNFMAAPHRFLDTEAFKFTDSQGDFLVFVLDSYSRFNIGQMENLLEQPYIWDRIGDRRSSVEMCIRCIKDLMGFAWGASAGIHNPEVPEAQQAYDVMCVIRHRLAWDRIGGNLVGKRGLDTLHVQYDEPSATYKAWDLPTIRKVT